MLHEEGLAAVFARHALLSETVTRWAAERGVALPGEGIVARSPTLTALRMPEGVDPAKVRASMRARGIQIAAGLGGYQATCVRVGHMGDIRPDDVARTLAALDDALAEAGV